MPETRTELMVTTYAGGCVQSQDKVPTESQGSAPLEGGGCQATNGQVSISIQMSVVAPTSPPLLTALHPLPPPAERALAFALRFPDIYTQVT